MFNNSVCVILLLLAAMVYQQHMSQQEQFLSGIVVPASPIQETSLKSKPFSYGEYTINPVAYFEIKALVLSAKHYSWGQGAKLAPVDLALGWGPMSDGDILKNINISQGSRWYFYRYKNKALSISQGDIISHSGNMHLIPSTAEIKNKIQKVHKGNVVDFKGHLVSVTKPDGWHWNTSQSRSDTGQGSCELVWVEEFKILDE